MRTFLALSMLPLLLSSCAFTEQDTRFDSITDGKAFVDFMVPHNLAASDASSRILRIVQDEATQSIIRSVYSTGNTEIGKMQLAYREFTGRLYPIHLLAPVLVVNSTAVPVVDPTPVPIVNLDGLTEVDATKAYVEAMITHHTDSIRAAEQAKKTGTGSTITALADLVIANRTKEIEQLKKLLPRE